MGFTSTLGPNGWQPVDTQNREYAAAVVGAAGGVPANVVVGDINQAAANVVSLQASLTYGGIVSLIQPGTIWINDTLIYDSNTKVVLGPNTTIKMVAGIRKPLLRSRAYYRMRDTPVTVTVTWSSGMTFSVAWTAHGFSKGDGVWINGSTLQAFYKGVFVVETVTDANNFVVRAARIPTATPTGTVVAVAATQHVTISGGTWDYNYDSTFAPLELDRFGMMHAGVYDVWTSDMRVDNAAKYAYWWCAHKDCGFDRVGSNKTNSDMCKIYAPGVGFRGRGLFGECGDDAISMQTKEPPAFIAYQPYYGDLIDCQVFDVDCTSSTSLAVFYANAIADGVMDRCGYDNVSGRAPNGFRCFTNTAEYSVGRVWARNVEADCTYPAKLDAFLCERLDLYDIHASTSKASPTDQVLGDASFYARAFNIIGLVLASESFASAAAYSVTMNGGSDMMRIINPDSKTSGSANARVCLLNTSSAVKHLYIDGANTDADQLVENQATNTPTITINGSRVGGACVASVRASCNINLTGGNDFTNASNGVVRFNATATVNLRTDGTNRLRAGSWATAPAGTPTLNMYGWDISVDPIAVSGASATNGQYCTSTQPTVEAGPAVRTPAGWVALGTGASGVNTVIV